MFLVSEIISLKFPMKRYSDLKRKGRFTLYLVYKIDGSCE